MKSTTMNLSHGLIIAAFALALSAFASLANAGQMSIIGSKMSSQSLFLTGTGAVASGSGNFNIGASASHHGATVGSYGSYSNTVHAGHHLGTSHANGNLNVSAHTSNTAVGFNGSMRTGARGNGYSNVTAGMGGFSFANRNSNGSVAFAQMGTGGTATSLGNVRSYTSVGGSVSAFAAH